MINLISEISKIKQQELDVNWSKNGNIALFDWALELAQLIRDSDENNRTEKSRIQNLIASLANQYDMKAITRRVTDDGWSG